MKLLSKNGTVVTVEISLPDLAIISRIIGAVSNLVETSERIQLSPAELGFIETTMTDPDKIKNIEAKLDLLITNPIINEDLG